MSITDECITANSYHNINSCKDTGNIDILLTKYQYNRDRVFNTVLTNYKWLIDNLWTFNSPLAIDRYCNYNLGCKMPRSKYCCAQCTNMKKIIDTRKCLVDNPFLIEYGERSGEQLILVKHNILNLFLKEDDNTLERYEMYMKLYPIIQCVQPAEIKRCIVGDNYTIKNIIIIMLQKYYNENGYNITPYMHTSFVCGDAAYSLHSVPTIGTYNMLLEKKEYFYTENKKTILNTSIAKGIVFQLFIILKNLAQFNFSHGNPCSYSLLFNKEPYKKTLNKLKIDSAISIQISNMWNSSATFEGNHYFSKSSIDDVNLENIVFSPEIEFKDDKEGNCLKYRLTNSNSSFYNSINSVGFPLFVGTYDFYCFFTSLMCKKEFYYSIYKDITLKKIWHMMWEVEDLEMLNNNLKTIHDMDYVETYFNLKRLINNKWMKCSILEDIFESLQD